MFSEDALVLTVKKFIQSVIEAFLKSYGSVVSVQTDIYPVRPEKKGHVEKRIEYRFVKRELTLESSEVRIR